MNQLFTLGILGGLGAPELIIIFLIFGAPIIAIIIVFSRNRRKNKP